MKSFISSVLLLIALTISSEAQQLSGTITNLNDKQILIFSSDTYLKNHIDTIYTNDNGDFRINLSLKKASYIQLFNTTFSSSDIYLFPGTDLTLKADGKNIETYYLSRQYSGPAAAINNYIADVSRSKDVEKQLITRATYNLIPEQFVSYIHRYWSIKDSLKQVWTNSLKPALKASKHFKEFLKTDSIQNLYSEISMRFSYLNGSLSTDQRRSFFNSYINPYSKPKSDNIHLCSPAYRGFWTNLIQYKSSHSIYGPKWYEFYQYLSPVIEKELSGAIKKITAASIESDVVRNYEGCSDSIAPILEKTFVYLLKAIDDPKTAKYFQKELIQKKAFREKVKTGKPAYNFTLTDQTGKRYLLSDFNGKAVYLDIWASWCGPCIALFPAAERLINKFKGNDHLVFITVSLDNDKEIWIKKGLNVYKPEGLQLYADHGFKSDFAKYYNIESIPRYIAIDREGKIVKFNAPRPDDEKGVNRLLSEISK